MTSDEADQVETETETDEGKGKASPNSEAAKHRVRARQAEAERDQLAARVMRLQTAEVRRLAARLADPDDLHVHGVQVADLLDEDGEVDEAKVAEAVSSLLQRRPRLALDYLGDADDLDSGVRTSVRRSGASWSNVLSNAAVKR